MVFTADKRGAKRSKRVDMNWIWEVYWFGDKSLGIAD
jgi:hypothetical protein